MREGSLVYATTRADNERMQRTLARYGFHQDGVAYRSARGGYDLVLFVQAGPMNLTERLRAGI